MTTEHAAEPDSRSLPVFFEAVFLDSSELIREVPAQDHWRDRSDDKYFLFESAFGVVRLRKRTAYPATFAHVEGGRLYAGYGDPGTGKHVIHSAPQNVPEHIFYEEFLCIEAICSRRQVVLQRDAFSTLPIFVGTGAGRLILSNHFERVCQLLDKGSLHADATTISGLLIGVNLPQRTLIKEIFAVYDRKRLLWSKGRLTHEAPPPTRLPEIVQQRSGDPHLFRQYLDDTLDWHWDTYSRGVVVAAELSGGLDSTLINGRAALQKRPMHAGTVLLPGSFGASQQSKLEDLQGWTGITSHTIPMHPETDFPLATMVRSGEWTPFYHNQELYLETFDQLAEYFAQIGAQVVFRGIGGDELGENDPALVQGKQATLQPGLQQKLASAGPWLTPAFHAHALELLQKVPLPPRTLLSASVADISLSANNRYLERDIWPASPLAHPVLYLYCQSLPMRYRYRKTLLRSYLKASGFPPSIYEPGREEHFGHFFYDAVQPHLQKPFATLMEHSVLADAGLVHADTARQTWSVAQPQNFEAKSGANHLFFLYRLLCIEANLQALGVRL